MILTLSIGLALALAGAAQEPSKEAKVERILALTHSEKMIDQVFNQMKTMAASQMPPGSTPEQRAKAQETQAKIWDLVRSRVNWEQARPEYVRVYTETFSDEELSGMLAFYDSPAGRAVTEKMPALMGRMIGFMQSQMADIMPEIQRIIKESSSK